MNYIVSFSEHEFIHKYRKIFSYLKNNGAFISYNLSESREGRLLRERRLITGDTVKILFNIKKTFNGMKKKIYSCTSHNALLLIKCFVYGGHVDDNHFPQCIASNGVFSVGDHGKCLIVVMNHVIINRNHPDFAFLVCFYSNHPCK